MKTTSEFIERIENIAAPLTGDRPSIEHGYKLIATYEAYYGEGHKRSGMVRDLVSRAFDEHAGSLTRATFRARVVAYVRATVSDITDGWDTDYMAAARVVTEGDLLDVADDLAVRSPMSAAMVAGAVLENHLRSLCVARGLTPKDRGISCANDKLKGPVYEKVQWREVQVWGDLRNAADHHDLTTFDASRVPAMLEGIRRLIEAYPK